MVDLSKRNGGEMSGRLEQELAHLEREREALEREREKLEREREKLSRTREEMEGRFERQEERLEQIEEELEAREEDLEEAEEQLEDLEVEGVEGLREVLDVVSDRIPHLVRGIQESIYSAARLKETAEAFAGFYKTLVDTGMPDHVAAKLTHQHFENLQSQVEMQLGPRKPKHGRKGVPGPDFDPVGPDFDPLGPSFDPFRRFRRGRPAEAKEPAEPKEPAERSSD